MAEESKNISNTMEINSILEEAKKNRNPQPGDNTEEKSNSANEASVQDKNEDIVDINDKNHDDLVVINENGSMAKPKKKKKVGLVITLIITGVIILVLLAGACWYFFFSGSSKMAKNVYVNDICLAGMTIDEAKEALKDTENALADKIKIDAKSADKTVSLTKDDFSYKFTTDEVLQEALEYSQERGFKSSEQKYEIEMVLDENGCDNAIKKVVDEVESKAQNAEVESFDSSKDDMFTYKDEVVGVSVKQDEFEKQLKNFVKGGKVSGELDVATDDVQPKYTKEYLQKNIKKLSSFTTTSTNNSNGNTNMEVSLAACNNSIINPGDTWSFNNCTGDSNLTSNGYKEAGVIVEGKHTTGVGGGICQSSTTIYNAALLCGMDVVERSCHYYKSSYADAGRDATVDYGNIDLKMKNPFDYQLFMKCYMKGSVLHCDMYGLPNDEFDEIKISSSVTSYFSNGFRAETSRTFYLDDKEVKTEQLPNSTYYTSEPSGSSDRDSSSSSGGGSESSRSSSSSSSSSGSSSSSKPEEAKPESKPDPEPEPEPEPEPTPSQEEPPVSNAE